MTNKSLVAKYYRNAQKQNKYLNQIIDMGEIL